MDSTQKPTRSITYWILFLSVEQFREFRKSCAPSVSPSDLFPGIDCPGISSALRLRGLVDRELGSAGIGARNTIRQHLRILSNLGLMFNRPGESTVYVPNSKAEDLYASVEAEGLLAYFMSRDAIRKLPELATFALLRRVPASRNEWHLGSLARLTGVGDQDRLRLALNHIGNWIEVEREGRTERVRLRTIPISTTGVRVMAEDQLLRDNSSSIMDQLGSAPAQGGPQGIIGPQVDLGPPFEPLGPQAAETLVADATQQPEAEAAGEAEAPAQRPAASVQVSGSPEMFGAKEEVPAEQLADPSDLAHHLRDLATQAAPRSTPSTRAIGGVFRSLAGLFENFAMILDPPR